MSAASYSKFTTFKTIKSFFQVSIEEKTALFPQAQELPISDYLQTTLKRNMRLALAINTEKARSEMIVAPILIELVQLLDQKISLFSGIEFNVDSEHGLKGRCDFLISQSEEQYELTAPVITVVEAKNDNINNGLAQCIATMVAAQLFNKQEGNEINVIYGVVTTGSIWQFLKLEANLVYIDTDEYHLNQVEEILWILSNILTTTKKQP